MNVTTLRGNYNHKLDWLIYLWQDTYQIDHNLFPTHVAFFHYCHSVFTKSHFELFGIFEKYSLCGIDVKEEPFDKRSQMCKDFFIPVVSLWHDVTGTPQSKLPHCEDIFILGEALEHCDAETYKMISYTYGFTGISESLSLEEETIVSNLRNRKRKAEIESVIFQYKNAKKNWKKFPSWLYFLMQLHS